MGTITIIMGHAAIESKTFKSLRYSSMLLMTHLLEKMCLILKVLGKILIVYLLLTIMEAIWLTMKVGTVNPNGGRSLC